MIQDLLLWSLQVSLLIVLMYGAYWLLFRKNTYFQLRRLTVLFCLLLAILIPSMEIEVQLPWSNPIERQLESITFEPDFHLETSVTISPQAETEALETSQKFSWQELLLNAYLIGLCIAAGLFLLEIIKLANWYYFGARRTDIQDNVITHKGIKYPFSFWKWIFIPQETDYDQDTWEIIEKHESAHLNQHHTLDMVLINLIQCFFWYNPVIYLIQRELKENHEALADRSVLNTTDFRVYAQALVSVSINFSALKLGHSFALISTLSKRITAMQTKRTAMTKTLSSVIMMTLIVACLTVANVLKSQDLAQVTSREEALEIVKRRNSRNIPFLIFSELTDKHQRILDRLKAAYPEKTILFAYSKNPQSYDFLERRQHKQKALYFDKLDDNEKSELIEIIKSDTMKLLSNRMLINAETKYKFSPMELMQEIETSINYNANYIAFYEPSKEKLEDKIYDISEVDIKPEPMGGIETFVRAIALDIEIPKQINKRDIPASIDFEVVINGGTLLTNIKLLTELKGSDKKNKEMYLFFGQVHDMMRAKVREFYVWKRGIKDGKEVRVRTTIAIPTKYMM
ncbi:M56 family metallopeptidase [Roseivirga sp. E12]|uniref:M56 family metallopeptidase n=1 Tax=Roseivirga sp. E12 TaxID=2819237 RepID=UPI001ABCC4AB|nr:M56 family metallopeptidase [Roseivirga sp. E12]MBO3699367.1 M56 family metallopeptidase [Roseivirga sp. E12]